MWLLEIVLYCVNVALNIISWFLQYFSLKKNVYEILLSFMISYTHILSHVPNEFIVMRSLHMIYYLHQTMRGRVERKLNWIPWIGARKIVLHCACSIWVFFVSQLILFCRRNFILSPCLSKVRYVHLDEQTIHCANIILKLNIRLSSSVYFCKLKSHNE